MKITRSQFVAPITFQPDNTPINTESWPNDVKSFNELIEKLRPFKKDIKVEYKEIDNSGLMFTLYVNNKPRHCGVDFTENKEEVLKEEVERITSKYDKEYHLWPGCRGDVAQYLNSPFNISFHQWFDQYASIGSKINRLKLLVEDIRKLENHSFLDNIEDRFIGTTEEEDAEKYPDDLYNLFISIEEAIIDIFTYGRYVDHIMRNKLKEFYNYKLTIGQKDREGVRSLFLYTKKGKIEIEIVE